MVPPADLAPTAELSVSRIARDLSSSPFPAPEGLRPPAQQIESEQPMHPR